ncbi:MAG: MBL fold metallo-hydrolase [Paludibacteraceae bacterium]
MSNNLINQENNDTTLENSLLDRNGICTFLGTGTSTGVPQLGCQCKVCQSADPRDKRLRCSALVTINGKRILIDAGPDLRQQLMTNQIYDIDATLLTHEHYDHVGGLDDIRPLGEMKIYGERNVLEAVQRNMPYCFGKYKYPGIPNLDLYEINEDEFEIEGLKVIPIRVMHAKLPILGYRISDMAYLTDVKTIPDREFDKLSGLKLLVLNALRKKEHVSHISLDEAIGLSKKIKAEKTYFTHASHQIGLQHELDNELPNNIHFAYDNLSIYF